MLRWADFTLTGRRRKSSRSNPNGACVEVATAPGAVLAGDSTLGEASPVLKVPPAAWASLTGRIKAGTLRL